MFLDGWCPLINLFIKQIFNNTDKTCGYIKKFTERFYREFSYYAECVIKTQPKNNSDYWRAFLGCISELTGSEKYFKFIFCEKVFYLNPIIAARVFNGIKVIF